MSIFRDISGKSDPLTVAVIADLDWTLSQFSVPFLLIGAAARDLVFHAAFNLPVIRKTNDVDLAVELAAWTDFAALVARLLGSGHFAKDTRQVQRFRHQSGIEVDIVPFGGIETPAGTIVWPPNAQEMSTDGMVEAAHTALVFRLRSEPPLDIQVCSPAGLAILKLFSWMDRRDRGGDRDALDLRYLLEHYMDVREVHPYQDDDIWADEVTYEQAGARLLGRHIARIATATTRKKLETMLQQESSADSSLRLAETMVRGRLMLGQEDALDNILDLLRNTLMGLREASRSE
jgi:predicted nucleotidyltransferase